MSAASRQLRPLQVATPRDGIPTDQRLYQPIRSPGNLTGYPVGTEFLS